MAESKNHNEVSFLTRLAGISVPEERLAALQMGLGGTQAICDALASVDYGLTAPSGKFTPPAAR